MLYQVIRIGFEVVEWLIIARVILSWVSVNPNNQLIRFIYEFTEPILRPIRQIMPRGSMPLDFSPIVAIILLELLQGLIFRLVI